MQPLIEVNLYDALDDKYFFSFPRILYCRQLTHVTKIHEYLSCVFKKKKITHVTIYLLTFPLVDDSFFCFQDDPMYRMNPADMKLEGSKAYKRKDYVTAAKLFFLVLYCIIPLSLHLTAAV